MAKLRHLALATDDPAARADHSRQARGRRAAGTRAGEPTPGSFLATRTLAYIAAQGLPGGTGFGRPARLDRPGVVGGAQTRADNRVATGGRPARSR
jgi:hypothetical protein